MSLLDSIKNLGSSLFGGAKQPQAPSNFNSFMSNYTNPQGGSLNSQVGGATIPNQINAQNNPWQGPTQQKTQNSIFNVDVKNPNATYTDSAGRQMGVRQVTPVQPTIPSYNPSSVNLSIGQNIPSDALNTTPSITNTRENRKDYETKVNSNRYDKEVESIMANISKLYPGIANLKTTQASEYARAEENPEGMFGPNALSSTLGRLSKDQALELNARTGQLTAQLDMLKMYQGYAPQLVGTPQIDETTGMAFAYIQDPMTGEVTTQDLGQITTPNPYANYQTISEGQTIIDPTTGKAVYTAPKTYAPTNNYGMGSFGGYGGSTGIPNLDLMVAQVGAGIASENQRNAFYNATNLAMQTGDQEEILAQLRNGAIGSQSATMQEKYSTDLTVLKDLKIVEDNLRQLENAGVQTNIFKGSSQSLKNFVGLLGDENLANVAYMARQAMDRIARSRTGAAFTESEQKLYKSYVPSIFKTSSLNANITNNLKQEIQNSLDSKLGLTFSDKGVQTLKGAPKKSLSELNWEE